MLLERSFTAHMPLLTALSEQMQEETCAILLPG